MYWFSVREVLLRCGEAGPLVTGWRCYCEPSSRDPLLIVVDQAPGRSLLRVHFPPEAHVPFLERTATIVAASWIKEVEEVGPLPHEVFEVELRAGTLATLAELDPFAPASPDEGDDRYIHDVVAVHSQRWRDGQVEHLHAVSPVGGHRRIVEQLLALAAELHEPGVDRRIEGVRGYLR